MTTEHPSVDAGSAPADPAPASSAPPVPPRAEPDGSQASGTEAVPDRSDAANAEKPATNAQKPATDAEQPAVTEPRPGGEPTPRVPGIRPPVPSAASTGTPAATTGSPTTGSPGSAAGNAAANNAAANNAAAGSAAAGSAAAGGAAAGGAATAGTTTAGTTTLAEASPAAAAPKQKRRWLRGSQANAKVSTTGSPEGKPQPPAADSPANEGTANDPAAPLTTGGPPPVGDDPQRTGPPGRGRKRGLPTERPPGAPPDPWTAFASTTERAPGRVRRGLRAVGRALIHEYALVIYCGLVSAAALTWPTLRYPLHTVPQEVGDPARQAWQVAWSGHILLTEPARLWQSNAFFPERYSFAFGNSLLGYAPAGMLGDGPLAATLRYNILFVLAHALLVIGGYALVRQLGAGRTGAAVAAVAFAYAPWRLAQEGHLDIVSAGAIPLALAMLARGHGWSLRYGWRPERRRPGWAVLGWLVAAWQVSLGFSLGLPFAYVLGAFVLVVAVAAAIRRIRSKKVALGLPLIVTDLLGVVIVAALGALIAIPYFKAPDTGPSATEIGFYSPPLRSLLIGPAQSRIWGTAHAGPRSSLSWPPEMTLLPGFVLYALALVGLVFSIWRWWQRLLLLLGVAGAVILTLGTTFFEGRWTYIPLFGHLPGAFDVRVPGRLMLWVTLLLAVLAAGAVAEFVRRAEHLSAQRIPPWPGPWLRLATLVPLLFVLVEGLNATPHPVVPAQPAAMRTVSGPMLVLPSATVTDQTVMLWSTSRFPQIANGGGGFAAARQADLRQKVAAFPDANSVQYLRGLGIVNVVLLRARASGTPWERAGDVPVDALGVRREDLDNGTVVFHLS